ncbi:MAG: ComF family protein [Spartobacteria bacterium]|nr:ComF family protein [Spartobacteria bacterium]
MAFKRAGQVTNPWRLFLDLLYPRRCAGCGTEEIGATPFLCWECFQELLPVQPPFCSVCGQPVWGNIDASYICAACSAKTPGYDAAYGCLLYEGLAREMIVSLKYNAATWLVPDLAAILEAGFRARYGDILVDSVAFVPLYHRKLRERGYNQAELLARRLARSLDKDVVSRCLVRKRHTPSQTRLTAAQRATNVEGAFGFRWRRWLEGKRILLIDDVMTTGATVSECARVLKKGGAARVYVLTAARGLR